MRPQRCLAEVASKEEEFEHVADGTVKRQFDRCLCRKELAAWQLRQAKRKWEPPSGMRRHSLSESDMVCPTTLCS